MLRGAFGVLAIVLASLAFHTSAFAFDEPDSLTLGGGVWEAFQTKYRSPEFDMTYRSGAKFLWIFRPEAGIVAAGDGDYLGFAGFAADLPIAQHVVATGSTSVGLWGGGGAPLGSRVEFRSGAELAWRFDNAVRIGAGFFHTSNADLTKQNPGSESFVLTYSIPLGFRLF